MCFNLWNQILMLTNRIGLSVQGGVFLLLFLGALGSYIVFTYTGRPWYIYGTLSLILLMATYAGFYCARMGRRFNTVVSSHDFTLPYLFVAQLFQRLLFEPSLPYDLSYI